MADTGRSPVQIREAGLLFPNIYNKIALCHWCLTMDIETSLALKIPIKQGESIRQWLLNLDLIRKDLKIKKNKNYLYIPIKKNISDTKFSYEVIELSFEKQPIKISQYQDLVSLPEELKTLLPTSFDIIGDIIVLKLPDPLQPYTSQIGKSLLKTHSHVKTVCSIDAVKGTYRTRPVTIIAGDKKTDTTHMEYGLSFEVDVSKTYFSPRLATERYRVASLVQPHEVVFDMFTGVAPFPLMIAKFAHPKTILGIDINPDAIQLAKRNIQNNHFNTTIEVLQEDAQNAAKVLDSLQLIPDRIIMNLPFEAFHFFPIALSLVKHQTIIHYYDMLKEEDIEKRKQQLCTIAQKQGRILDDFFIHRIKTYAPHEFYIGFDITAKRITADVA